MAGICLPIDAGVDGSPSFPAAQHRVALASLMGPINGRPLGARSGVRPGADPVVAVTATTWTVQPFTCRVDPGTAATVGPYLVAFLAAETGSIDPADQNNTRLDRLDVVVPNDPPGTDPRTARIIRTPGQPSATPSLPGAPAQSTFLGTITVPKVGGGSPVWTPAGQYAVASGGILPVPGSALNPASPYDGEPVYDRAQKVLKFGDGGTFVAAGNGLVTAAPRIGTFDPSKPVLRKVGYVETTPDSGGFVHVSTPGGTCVVWASAMPSYRVTPQAAAMIIAWRADASTGTDQVFQFRNPSTGAVITATFVAYQYDIHYQA